MKILSKVVIVTTILVFFLFMGNFYIEYTKSTEVLKVKTSTPENFKVAFIADQGLNQNSVKVLKLIKEENASMVLHSGDLDYMGNPNAWDQMISNTLGEEFPYFITIGNHEIDKWSKYQKKAQERLDKVDGAYCVGDLGLQSACTYKGIFFISSGIGTKGYLYNPSNFPEIVPWRIRYPLITFPSQIIHTKYIKEQLKYNTTWKICSIHKNQRLMQPGNKQDEIGWQAYEECKKEGAMIVAGHEHSYARTYLMESLKNQKIASTSNTIQLEPGKTFIIISGLAGQSIRPENKELASSPWWAAIYTATQNAQYGALFCTFNYQGKENVAYCYFKDIASNIPDEFYIVNQKI